MCAAFGAWLITRGRSNEGVYLRREFFNQINHHRLRRISHPVCSAMHKRQIGRSVVGWVTTSESRFLYDFLSFVLHIVVKLLRCELCGVAKSSTKWQLCVRIRGWPWSAPNWEHRFSGTA